MKKLNLSVLLILFVQIVFAQNVVKKFDISGITPQNVLKQGQNNVVINQNNNVVINNASINGLKQGETLTFESKLWRKKNESVINVAGTREIIPVRYKTVELKFDDLKTALLPAVLKSNTNPSKAIIIDLPDPDGGTSKYMVYKNTTMATELEDKFPEIRTFDAISIDHPGEYGKIDVTPKGFHAMIFSTSRGTFFIDPYSKNDVNNYLVYYRKDFVSAKTMNCLVDGTHQKKIMNYDPNQAGQKPLGSCDLRTYRLALAATAEYTAFHGGTVAAALAAQVVTMNRVNGVFERDAQITMTIIGNNNLIIYTSNPDPYTNNNGATMLGENQTNINAVIGAGNYDIGHVFSTGGGGIAQLFSPCSANKARGVTGSGAPVNDPFDIDYVAHEMGHQWGGNHTQNNNCNRNNATAMEPGSASSIMGYAGICAPNVQNNSDDHFHGVSIAEMSAFIVNPGGGSSCDVLTAVVNVSPTITGTNGNITIPASTPFALTATATDPNAANVLSYCWEQMDNQVTTQPPVSTATGGPSFRSVSPMTSPTRYFPNLADLMSGGPFTWEVLSTVNRTMNFRVTVRDNAGPLPEVSCLDQTDVTITVDASTGPFVVTYPSAAGITWTGATSETVLWNVAGTTGGGVNCANVDIFLSTDGGVTFPTLLAAGVPNDGSQAVTVPNTPTTTAVIMVMCANGTFFDISDNVFTIVASTFDYTLASTPTSISICPPLDANYSIDIGSIGGYSDPVTLSISGVPGPATSSFSVNPVVPGGSSTLNITNTAGVVPGSYPITVSATSTSGPKSIIITFIVSDPAPTVVTLTTPADLSVGVPMPVSFAWSAAAGVGVVYDIDIATDVAFASIVDNAVGLVTNSYVSVALAPTTLYYWRVRAYNGCGTAPFSTTFEFTTGIPAGCDTLNFPIPGTPQVYGGAAIGGYVTGWNTLYQDVAKAEYFSAASHAPFTDVTGGLLALYSAADGGNGATVDFNVWDATGAGGSPGTILGTFSVPLTALNTNPAGPENAFIEILYNSPINVGAADFYFGIAMNGFGAGDSLGFWSNTDGDNVPATAWEEWGAGAGGGWVAYDGTGGWGLDIGNYFSPYMTDVPPIANITTNSIAICEGDSIAYDGTTSVNTSAYNWIFPSGLPATSTASTQNVTYATAGNFTGYLVAGGACQSQAVDSIAITVTANVTPTFNPVAAICDGDALAPLPTTSTNAITGTWSPALDNTTTTLYTFTPTAGLCATTTTLTITVNPNVTPTFNPVAAICDGDPLSPLPTTSTNAITGTWAPALDNTTTTLYTFTPTAGQCATTTTLTITVNPNVTPTFNPVAAICDGDALAPLPTTSTNAITGTWAPALDNTTTTLYTFTPTAGQCATTATLTITVNAQTVPTFAPVAAICSGDALSPLPTTSTNAITGTWAPALDNTTTTLYTFTPTAGQCATTATLTITVNAPTVPTFAPVAPICTGDPLSPLPTTSTNAITGTWAPALDNTTTTLYTFTPTAGQCATTTTLTIVVNSVPTLPTFNPVAPICDGDALSPLPTTSTNGFIGTWAPALDNTTTTLYTFTPAAGQCATTATLTITVNPNVIPTFNPVAAICDGDALSPLPTTSTNAITGTWSPALDNTTTTLYTFTPTAGQCATTATLTITVNAQTVPTFAPVAAICSGDVLSPLPTTSTNAITGTWAPALDNTTTTLYTFTPTAGQCATTATLTITVNPPTVPTFAPVAAICDGDALSPLPTTSTNAITGTWSPALDNTTTTLYTFTPTAGQCATAATLTITVNPNVTPTFNAVAAICDGDALSPLPTTSTNAITGTWSPALDNTTTTLYTFTPAAGQCATTATLTITVNPNVTPTFAAVAAICSGDVLSPLPTTSTNAITGTWSPALDNTTTTLYTFTPTAGQCATTATLTITVNPLPTVVANATSTNICSGNPVTLTGSGATGYTWDNGVTDGVAFNPLVSTLYTVTGTDGNGCQNTDTISVFVTSCGAPVASFNSTNTNLCIGDCIDFNDLSTGAPTGWNWYFFGATTTTSNSQNPTNICYAGVGSFDVALVAINGVGQDSLFMPGFITVNANPAVVANTTGNIVCSGDAVTLTGTGATSYAWDNGVTDGVAFNPASTILYTVTGTDGNGCQNTDAITVNVNPLPIITASNDTTICATEVAFLSASGGINYTWDNGVGSGQTQTVSPSTVTTYMVTGDDVNGCSSTDVVIVSIDNSTCFNIPNVFSPNGDGKNDTWMLRGIEQFPNASIAIFNRWGGEMYSSTGYSDPWDGTFNGTSSPSATYYYIIDLGDGQELISGTVNIIR